MVEGTWKAGSRPESLRLPVYDTRGWVKNLFRAALAAQGIQFTPGPAVGGTDRDLVIYSAPLAELLKPFLKNSVNMMGDAFLKALSADAVAPGDEPGLLAPALVRLAAFLREYGDERDFTLHDGSGLSRTSRVTPAFVFGYLERVSRAKWFPALYAALPIAGVDGTLRERMRGTAAAGRLRAKTGTLDGAYNLAGYVPSRAGYVPFVLYTRTDAGLAAPAKAAEDRVGARLAALNTDAAASVEPAEPYPFVPEHAGADAP